MAVGFENKTKKNDSQVHLSFHESVRLSDEVYKRKKKKNEFKW